MEWNERELAWLNRRRNFIETHDFTDIRIELIGEFTLDLGEKNHLMAALALVMGLDLSIEVEKGFNGNTRTRLVILDPNGGKQRLAVNSYGVKPEVREVIKNYESELKAMGCSDKLVSEVMGKTKIDWR